MTDKKRPADPFAATVPPGGPAPKQPAAPAPPSSDPRAFAVTGRADDADLKAALAAGATHPAGLAGIDPLGDTSHASPAVTADQAGASATIPGQPPMAQPPAPPPAKTKSRGVLWAVLALLVAGGGIAAFILGTSRTHTEAPTAGSGQASAAQPAVVVTPPIDAPAVVVIDAAAGSAGSAASDAPTSLETLLAVQDKAIADGTSAPFQALLAPDVFGFGIDASEVRVGRDDNYELVRHVIGMTPMTFTKKLWTGKVDHGAWIAEVLTFADKHVVELTELANEHDGRWQIDAWHWALPIGNMDAYKLAKADKLAAPAVIPASSDEDAAVADAAGKALNDRSVYVHAISPRPDTFAFGSAPGEVMAGGDVVTRVFKAMTATFAITSGPYVKKVGDGLAFAAANVSFTNPAGTQTFRVLLVLQYADYWRITQAHWSNGGPF